ncbi:autoinducer binding domain-containing protein (plasmid) [Cereibacter azotoformans]|uniref:helix-turn-helix transcriptional regulator n=1 Tax=Cereibacter azotoformans TaxID=43057 RepID=UPI003B216848
MSNHIEKEKLSLRALAPAGYYVGVRIRFVAPETELNTLPTGLLQTYSIQGMALHDPMMRWAFQNSGILRWNELENIDPANVFGEYRRHGLAHGAVISILTQTRQTLRTIGVFARSDRDYSDPELLTLRKTLNRLHGPADVELSPGQIEVLRLLAQGHRYKRIAHILGITESGVKARLKSAALSMGAQTPAQTLRMAVDAGLLTVDLPKPDSSSL